MSERRQSDPGEPYILSGAAVSLYSGKARAYLRYKGIPFQERLSTLKVYRDVIAPNVHRRVIPVVHTPEGEYLQDSTVIIDALEPRFPEYPVYPQTPAQRLVERRSHSGHPVGLPTCLA